jgi:hypothetical protein
MASTYSGAQPQSRAMFSRPSSMVLARPAAISTARRTIFCVT